MTYRMLVTGSRDWTDKRTIRKVLLRVWKDAGSPEDVVLVSGACPTGADAYAEVVGAAYGWTVETHPADWTKGRSAGPIRNQAMVDLGADICVAFPKGDSRGTAHCMRVAKKAGIPVLTYYENLEE